MKSLIFFMIIFWVSACSKVPSSMVDKVGKLGLPVIEGEIKTYYSQAHENRAAATRNLLQESTGFFEEQFGISQPFSLAVLNSSDWQKITPIPYGLPFVSGPPYFVCIPADSQNELSRTIANAIEGKTLDARYGLSNKVITNLYISLIGFHELGHMYAHTYGISFPNRWTFEFTATYFAYSYLDQHFTQERDLWIEVSKILVDALNPRFTSLEDFEQKYTGVGIKNYAWYQVVYLLQVDKLYAKHGKTFIERLRTHQWRSNSETEYLEEMEEMGSGFNKWAQQYNLLQQSELNK